MSHLNEEKQKISIPPLSSEVEISWKIPHCISNKDINNIVLSYADDKRKYYQIYNEHFVNGSLKSTRYIHQSNNIWGNQERIENNVYSIIIENITKIYQINLKLILIHNNFKYGDSFILAIKNNIIEIVSLAIPISIISMLIKKLYIPCILPIVVNAEYT
ncbi:hypothetical protein MXB_3582, partial [Myxobolus squamalis]